MRAIMIAVVAGVILPGLQDAGAAVHTVTSAAAFNALALAPGDEVVWRDGTYSGQVVNFLAHGTAAAPIVLRAETRGGVVFTGDSALRIGGSHLVVDGFFWDGSAGLGTVVEFRRSGSSADLARDCVLRHCALRDLPTAGDTKSTWIRLYGYRNTVEFCSLIAKKSTGEGILVELAYNDGTPPAHVIRNNFFHDFPSKDGRTNANDSEGIRVGVSSLQAVDARVVVEGNYFLGVNGENEIISNKSANNRYLRNTFRRCRGALVLRHGAGARVEGNFFLGEGAANTGGVRVTDQDHVIINNYMEGLRGTTWNAGLTWVAGNTASGGTSSGYQYVANVLAAFNTLADCTQSVYLNSQSGTRAPVTSVMANNIVYSTRGTLIQGTDAVSLAGISFEGNLMAGAPVGHTHAGISTADPLLRRAGLLLQPSEPGPAINAAAGTHAQVTTDVLGRLRPAIGRDIGAMEVDGGEGPALYRPWRDSDVGRGVGAAFLPLVDAWLGYEIAGHDGAYARVETGGWLGTVWVSGDWAYAAGFDQWLFIPASDVDAGNGAWAYLPALPEFR